MGYAEHLDLDDFVEDYLLTALWAETVLLPCGEDEIVDGCMDVDENHPLHEVYECEPLDKYFQVTDFDADARALARTDCERFLGMIDSAGLLERALECGDIAHNFWLTRNGHGAGFWDGDFADIGDELSDIAKDFGDCTVLTNDDGSLSLSG